MPKAHLPLALIILDGWGYRENVQDNAIANAQLPYWQALWQQYPHTLLTGSGLDVGLPKGQMGNSEVGHLNIGAGRVVYQDFTRIEQALEKGDFFTNPVLLEAIQYAANNHKTLHILGLLSPGGVHSHERHMQALAKLAVQQGLTNLCLHAFLDGRDTPPQSALASLEAMQQTFTSLGCGRIASIIGRYYAMDRDQRWERIQIAYDLLTLAHASYSASSATEALSMAYARGETDEFVQATVIKHPQYGSVKIEDGDVVVFMNFRSDRARQLTRAFTEPGFNAFPRQRKPALSQFVTLTQYATDIKSKVAYPPQQLDNVLGAYLAKLGLKQLRIAETEKYAHVTFFFNGGIEQAYAGEERILIPSAKVATYDLQPEMAAYELTDKLVAAINSRQYDVIICNYANPDMVGHTGDYQAAIRAVEVIDACLGKVIVALQAVGGEAIITADHGNVECMRDTQTGQPHTAHTNEPVPFLYIGRPAQVVAAAGSLADIAPTMLHLMHLPQPEEMTGKALVRLEGS